MLFQDLISVSISFDAELQFFNGTYIGDLFAFVFNNVQSKYDYWTIDFNKSIKFSENKMISDSDGKHF